MILVRTKFLLPTFSCPLDIVMKGFRVISLHPKNYTKPIKFACLSEDLLPCTVLGFRWSGVSTAEVRAFECPYYW